MARYNHAFTIAFSLTSETESGEDVTAEMLKAAVERRISELDRSRRPDRKEGEWIEAVGAPYDTYQEDD